MKAVHFASVHFASYGHGLSDGHVEQLIAFHREYGMRLTFLADDTAALHLDGDAGAMVTELLRLAEIGRLTVKTSELPGGGAYRNLVVVADIAWEKRFR